MAKKSAGFEWIVVKESKIHGKGVFAKKKIPKGTKVIEYVGEKITKKEAEKRADRQVELAMGNGEVGAVYIFELNKRYDIDGNVEWNPAKWINHSCDPNCEAEIEDGHIWITSIRDIEKGEEITYNYGYDIDNYKDHPCRCGSKNCVGYILDKKYWKRLKKKLNS